MNQRHTGRNNRSAARLLAVIMMVGLSVVWGLAIPAGVSGQATQPVILATGQWMGADAAHQAQGKVRLIRLPDGRRFLRFEEFRVTNGPDLYVYLSGHRAPRNRAQLHEGAALEVGVLKGNIGNQNYELPADLDLSKFKSAAIYCKRFSVMFGSAELVSP